MNSSWSEYISFDPEIQHGETCLKGARIPVAVIVGSVKAGMTSADIIHSYPQLTEAGIQAALSYNSDRVWEKLMKLKDELERNWHSEKSAVDILFEMRR